MILVDANVLLYAYDASAPLHEVAERWWQDQLSRPRPVRLAWVTVVAFVRIGTNPRVFSRPLTVSEACAHVSSWLDQPMVEILSPSEQHWTILQGLLKNARASGNLVTDAHLAALAIEHEATLCSTDRDFRRFDGLTWQNPLVQT